MAKIVLSDIAPEGHTKFTLGADEVEAPFETNDPVLISNARSHPWLLVEDEEGAAQPPSYVNTLSPSEDSLSAVNSIANDPDEVRKALEERGLTAVARTAIDANLDQNEVVELNGVALTVAAEEDAEPVVEGREPSGDDQKPQPEKVVKDQPGAAPTSKTAAKLPEGATVKTPTSKESK
jgi:hypothetical protein